MTDSVKGSTTTDNEAAGSDMEAADRVDDAQLGLKAVDHAAVTSQIRSHVIASMGLGLVPVPVFDVVAVVGVQLKLIHSLTKTYEVKYSENIAKTLVLSLIGGIVPVALGGGLASIVKMIPGLGSFAGAAGVSVLAGALTYAVGRVFAAHFESGGTLMDFNASKMRAKFREQFRKGKEVASQMAEEEQEQADAKSVKASAA